MAKSRRAAEFLKYHSLSIASIGILILWLALYTRSSPDTHWGAFFGNAIADWSGSVVLIIGTKFLIEVGSAESRTVHGHWKNAAMNFLHRHSLLLFLFISGAGWVWLYSRLNAGSKWGQVVASLTSEWIQMAGLVFLTKELLERGSRESR